MIVGYSVNDTVIVHRIHEHAEERREPLASVMNRSINETQPHDPHGRNGTACLAPFSRRRDHPRVRFTFSSAWSSARIPPSTSRARSFSAGLLGRARAAAAA
jgi:hypothetical protein